MADSTVRITAPEQVAAWIAEVMRGEVETSTDGFLISGRGLNDRRISLTNARVHDLNSVLQQRHQDDETVLWDSRTFEMLVREESRFGPPLFLRESGHLHKEDTDNGLTYSVGKPSDLYALFLLTQVGESGALRLRMPIASFRIERMLQTSEGTIDAIEFFKGLMPRLITVRVEATRPRTLSELAQLASAFLFHLTYNIDVPFVETRSWEDLLRATRIRSRRSAAQDIEPPRRHYIRDLIYHYQMAVASDSPVLAFLSYYHVAEHFFERVFNDDLIASVRDQLTQPGFSYRRKKDIDGLIRGISKRLQIRGESTVFSEREALRLTLERFVRISDLAARLQSYDSGLVSHYSLNTVSFCDGETVDLNGADESKTFQALAKRLYKTRNATVHSKDGDKDRYVPFQHDRILTREIPLIRFIAEDIIIGSSTLMQ